MENRTPMCPYMAKTPMSYPMNCPWMTSSQMQCPCMVNPMMGLMRTAEDGLEFEDDDDVTRAPDKVDLIVQKIENESPTIFNNLKKYKIPYMVFRRILRRIVYLTLLFADKIK
jgi:hypothetical protein